MQECTYCRCIGAIHDKKCPENYPKKKKDDAKKKFVEAYRWATSPIDGKKKSPSPPGGIQYNAVILAINWAKRDIKFNCVRTFS